MRFAALLAFAAVGCDAEPSPIALTFESGDFSAAEESAIRAGASEWGADFVRDAPESTHYLVRRHPTGDAVAAYCDPVAREIRIRPDVDGDLLRIVGAHETGHALGLGHAPHGIMRSDVSDVDYVTQHDIARLRSCRDGDDGACGER